MFVLNKLVRKNILELKPYSSARDDYSGKEGVFLDANENPFGTLNRYPDPHQKELKDKLSRLKSIHPDNIFIGNGSDEIIDLAFRIFCSPGKNKALTFTPTYGMYAVSSAINEVELIHLPLNASFQINFDELEKHLEDESLRLIFICSPNNPTGNSISNIDLILKKFNGIVMVDEAYIDFSETSSCISKINQFPNLIVMQTFSKAWGLAAARVGTAYANAEVIALFNKVKPPYNVSELNQKAALSALEKEDEFNKTKKIILTQKEWLQNQFLKVKLVKKIYPSDANFILVEFSDANKTYTDLINQKVITRNRNSLVKNCIRISVGTPEENEKLINVLQNLQP